MEETNCSIGSRGKAAWRTCCSSVCPSGHRLDALKSAVQKYLRRREEGKMLWCVAEIYSMHSLACTPQEKQAAKGIVTNLINRLIVMMDEELLFADWATFLNCRRWITEFDAGGRSDFGPLVKVCRAMCAGELLRLNSDIRGYWGRRAGSKVALCACPLGDLTRVLKPADAGWTGDKGRAILAAFAGCLRARDSRAYKWGLLMMRLKGRGARRWRRTEPVWAAWEVIMDEARGKSARLKECLELKRLEFQKKDRSERHMWLSSAVSLILHCERIDWDERLLEKEPSVSEDEVRQLLEDRGYMLIDSYAIDQHCKEGRALGRGRKHFREEGSVVVGENKEYFVAEWRNGYKQT